jgi:hypothetical protein
MADPSFTMALVETLKVELRELHRPRKTAGGVRCITCAEFYKHRLHRAQWPCKTAELLGFDKE